MTIQKLFAFSLSFVLGLMVATTFQPAEETQAPSTDAVEIVTNILPTHSANL